MFDSIKKWLPITRIVKSAEMQQVVDALASIEEPNEFQKMLLDRISAEDKMETTTAYISYLLTVFIFLLCVIVVII